MGCGESKHDVANGNTIARKKSNVGEQSTKSKDIDNVQETETKGNQTIPLVQQQQQHQDDYDHGDRPAVADVTVREVAENTETLMGKEQKEKRDGVVVEEQEGAAGRLISNESPNEYYSSRKEEEAMDGIVSEGKSDCYSTPRHEAGEASVFNDNERVKEGVEATNLVEKTVGETKIINAEIASVKDENLVNEKEKGKANVAAEVSVPEATVENTLNDDMEQPAASPTQDVKTA